MCTERLGHWVSSMVRARPVRGVDAPGGLSFALAWSGGSHGAFDPRPDAFRLRLSICFELVSQLSHTLVKVVQAEAQHFRRFRRQPACGVSVDKSSRQESLSGLLRCSTKPEPPSLRRGCVRCCITIRPGEKRQPQQPLAGAVLWLFARVARASVGRAAWRLLA